ncbi:MAG: HEPN domain-containing protein [Butyrivibrio sp.]|nr:HEPN domain-containing protein [Butyrivibrio sp.]MBR1642142.1 HEPN domain-containing protein [Butyrivibrio sp.]
MDKETYQALAKARLERAQELVNEAEELLERGSYKSANNRAFYSIEKSLRAMLAIKGIDADSHNGILRQFNVHFIRNSEAGFEQGDYKVIANAQRIRNISDYDDFYIADKEECREQVKTAKDVVKKAQRYLETTLNSTRRE